VVRRCAARRRNASWTTARALALAARPGAQDGVERRGIRRAADRLPPTRICATYTSLGGGRTRAMLAGMWAALGADTVACLAGGARTLAALWSAAYAGPGPALAGVIARDALAALHNDVTQLPSLHPRESRPQELPTAECGTRRLTSALAAWCTWRDERRPG